MKQMFKKFYLFILVFVLVIGFSARFILSADSDDYKEASEKETSLVFGNMTANTQRIETINNGTQDNKSSKYFWNNHTVHWIIFFPISSSLTSSHLFPFVSITATICNNFYIF